MQSKLLDSALDMVRSSDEPLSHIARGAGVPYHWLYSVVNTDRVRSPNVIYVEALYVYLSGKPLDLS